jgi:hypothetical protein
MYLTYITFFSSNKLNIISNTIIMEGLNMVNINCSLGCIYEEDGKCNLTHIAFSSSTPHAECMYFIPKATSVPSSHLSSSIYKKTE